MPPPKRSWVPLAAVAVVAVVVVAAIGGYLLLRPASPASPAPAPTSCGGSPCGPIADLTVDVEGLGNVAVTCNPNPGACTYANGDTGDFTRISNNCSFSLNNPPGASFVLSVDAANRTGEPLNGVTVTLNPGSGLTDLTVSPSLEATTGSSSAGTGVATFTSVAGYIAAGDASGGTISVAATFSSNGVSSSLSANIAVEPPPQWSC